MAETLQIYKCAICGNIVEVVHGSTGELVCCGQPMELLDEKTADATTEKHVPVIEKIDGGYKVTVGSTLHPMEEKHYIEWIELLTDGKAVPQTRKIAFGGPKAYRQFLNPGDAPQAEFSVEADSVTAREYCNVHGLWKGN